MSADVASEVEYDRAIQDLDQAIKLDPNLALAYNNRGNASSLSRCC
jgi:tetratricopeptide (TPR) repeat protein